MANASPAEVHFYSPQCSRIHTLSLPLSPLYIEYTHTTSYHAWKIPRCVWKGLTRHSESGNHTWPAGRRRGAICWNSGSKPRLCFDASFHVSHRGRKARNTRRVPRR
uniref:Uncharacterized protein n=1 Tax=Physcomitrium patens TaxID=3218 RepID=A0A2K1IN35_PHYPA|nr:hypothetical protein PHYPA_027000 [Physcomitrium patens]